MSLLYGENEALERVRGQMKQRNTGGIMYPSGTNGRGNPGGREAHASGDCVGGSQAMAGVVEKNRRNAIRQTRNEMGRSAHATGDSVQTRPSKNYPPAPNPAYYNKEKAADEARAAARRESLNRKHHDDGDMVERKAGGNPFYSPKELKDKMSGRKSHKGREEHKFGSGIGSDFKKLGHDVKKGWGKEIGHPFKENVTEPSKRGMAKAGEGLRRTANVAEHETRRGAAAAKRGAEAAGRAVRNEYRKHGRD